MGRYRLSLQNAGSHQGGGAHLSLLEQGEPLPTRSRGLPVLLKLPGMSRRRPERPGAARAGGLPQLVLFVLKRSTCMLGVHSIPSLGEEREVANIPEVHT